MFEKLNKFRKKTVARDYIILVVMTCLFLIGLYFYKYHNAINDYKISIHKIENEQKVILENEFDNIKSDIEYLSSSYALIDVVKSHNSTVNKEIKRTFYNFMKAKGKYDQLRLLDKNGNEIIRIDKQNLVPFIVKDEDLQNKSTRYYFKDAIKLRPKDIYISQLDLNQEHGSIEIPIKPMLRFVKPLYDNKLNFQGAIIFNFKANKMLEKLQLSAKELDVDMIMLNKLGNIIEHPNFNYNWSFMYKDAKIKSLEQIDQSLWKKVTGKKNYFSSDSSGIYSIKEYYPYKLLLNDTNYILSDIEKKWYIVLGKNDNAVNKIIISEILSLVPFILSIILVLVIMIWRLTKFRYQLKTEADHKSISVIALNETSQAILISDRKYKIVHVNKAFSNTTGYSENEAIGYKANSFIANSDKKQEEKSIFDLLSFKDNWEGVIWNKRKDDVVYPSLVKIDAVRENKDYISYYLISFNDLREHIDNQKSIELKSDYISPLDNVSRYNTAQERMKYDKNTNLKSDEIEPLGQLIVSIANEIDIPLSAVSESSSDIHRDFDTLIKNIFSLIGILSDEHKKLFIDIVTNDLNFSQIACFIDENFIKETIIQKLEKENITNVNKIVKVIMHANLVDEIDKIIPLLKLDVSSDIIDTIDKICSIWVNTNNIELAVTRASSIVSSLEHFSNHSHSHDLVLGQLSQSIESVLVVYQGQIERDIKIKKDFANVDSIYCDFDELFKVWSQILQNAIHAMNYKGEIKIKIAESNQYQIVEITDDGVGMDDDIKDKLFVPFFTTKPKDKGLGLDLSSVKKIVERHKGKIEVESELGQGSTFRVYINKSLNIKK